MRPSSSEHDSVGSRDTGIDLNPDDVPVGYHPSVNRLLAHRRRSRSVAPSRSAAADNVPRVIDADDETDDPSVVGKDATASSRRSTSHSASFDKTMEWLMTRTGSHCPSDQFAGPCYASLSRSSSHLCDAQDFDDVADSQLQTNVTCDEPVLFDDPHCRPRGTSPSPSVCPLQSECAADKDECRLAVSSDDLNIGLHRRVVDSSAASAEHPVGSDIADYRHRLPVPGTRQTLRSLPESQTDVWNRRRPKQKVSLYNFF